MDLTKEAVAQQAAATGILVQDLEMENQLVGLFWTSELRTCLFSPREEAFFLVASRGGTSFRSMPDVKRPFSVPRIICGRRGKVLRRCPV